MPQKTQTQNKASVEQTARAEEAASHGQAAKQHAAEASHEAKVSADEATLAAKDKLSQAGQAVEEGARGAKEATKEAAGTAADTARSAAEVAGEYGRAAEERATHAAGVAKDKLSEAGETLQQAAASAIEFVKSKLPPVEHQEPTPQERATTDLLEEAMGHSTNPTPTQPPSATEEQTLYPASTTPVPGTTTDLPGVPGGDVTGLEAAPLPPTAPAPPFGAKDATAFDDITGVTPPAGAAGGSIEPPYLQERYPPGGGDAVSEKAQHAAEEAKHTARGLVEKASHAVEGAGRTADSAMTSPTELRAELQERERHGDVQGPLHALTAKAKETAHDVSDYVRHRRTHPPHPQGEESKQQRIYPHGHPQHRHVKEVSALPGDIHVPLIAQAISKNILHRPSGTSPPYTTGDASATAAETTKPQARRVRDAVAEAGHQTAESAEAAAHDASEAADRAKATASDLSQRTKDTATGVAQSVGDTLGRAYHKVADPLAESLHTLEDKTSWAVHHTKEELSKSAEETHREMAPTTIEETKRAHGEVPMSTQEVLASSSLAPTTPHASPAASEGEREALGAVETSVMGYGGTEQLGAEDVGDVARGAEMARGIGGVFRSAAHEVDAREAGVEGELPS